MQSDFWKWLGVVLCLALIACMIASRNPRWLWHIQLGSTDYRISLASGAISIDHWPTSQDPGKQFLIRYFRSTASQWRWWFDGDPNFILIPLWFPLMLIGVPTWIAFRRARRIPPH